MNAFPSPRDPKTGSDDKGMSLRDYMAAKALQPVLDDYLSSGWTWANPEIFDLIASNCYEIADAMLKARDK
jgi:hypothetical protein